MPLRQEAPTFPIMGVRERGIEPTRVPWARAAFAFEAYHRLYRGQTLERIAERGGFSPGELFAFSMMTAERNFTRERMLELFAEWERTFPLAPR